jgi:hypothetical protein
MKLAPLMLVASTLMGADAVPDWVREAAGRPAPVYPAKVSRVVLLAEEHVTIDPEGRQAMHERGAIRIVQKGGGELVAYRPYNGKSGRIASFQGWLLPPSAKPIIFAKNAIVDQAAAPEYTYCEERVQYLNPGNNLEPGSVFAWEVLEEEKAGFTFDEYDFQEDLPVLVSRFVLSLPAGWEVRGTMLNHDRLEPQVNGSTYTWELRDLPWIEPEERSPGFHAVAPRLGVNYFPAGGGRPDLRPLKDWRGVSEWLSELADPSAEVTDSIRRKAAELVSGASSEIEKIRAIGGFVQKTNYVEVAINLAHGGGFTPRRAEQSLSTNYGDCKDKATLMRALLKAVGIESYMVVIDASDREYVRPEWPAPQFDHAIVAIRVSPDINLPAVIEHERLGRLLIFDPTDWSTPVGDVRLGEQGNHALVLAGGRGELVTVPLLPPALSRIESRAEAKLEATGRLSAHVSRTYYGQSACRIRAIMLHERKDEIKRTFERSLSASLGGVSLDRIEPSDRFEEGRLEINLDFSLLQFGRIMQDRMFVISPGLLALGTGYALPAKERRLPVKLPARARKDSVVLAVPAGLKVDELPDPVKIDSPYGSYRASWKVDGDKVLFEHSIEVKDTLAPVSEYTKIKKFLEDIASSQAAPVVLLKP